MATRAPAIEVEWQFATRDVAAVRRWLAARPGVVAPAAVVELRDVYLDTADWRLRRSGDALRVRRCGDGVEATLKALRRPRGAVARRRELGERLADARLATVRVGRGPVARRLRRVLGAAPLRRLFRLRTTRRTYVVRVRGRAVAELAIDRTVVVATGRATRRLARVEVELKRGRVADLAPFVAALRRACDLRPARRSKFEEGLRAAGLAPR